MSLERFGWNSHFESEFTHVSESGSEPARIALADRERFVVWREAGESEASVCGGLRHRSGDWPAVGDWVALESGCRIAHILARQTAFSRKQAGVVTRQQVLAANIDVLFVVSGLDGDFNPRRIERYLLLAWESGAKPVVVLNKADVCADVAEAAASVAALVLGAPVLPVSALENRASRLSKNISSPGGRRPLPVPRAPANPHSSIVCWAGNSSACRKCEPVTAAAATLPCAASCSWPPAAGC